MSESAVLRPAAQLLLVEEKAIRPILESTPADHFDRSTVCDGWSVRDVLSHCGAALTMTANDELHGFTPDENERDVDMRRRWPIADVLAELFGGYRDGARAIDAAGGQLDGVGLGEWIHGGDVREALQVGTPYASGGSAIALELLLERSVRIGTPRLVATIDDAAHRFGAGDTPQGRLDSNLETFVRLCGGRRPDPARYRLTGVDPRDIVLFS